MDGGGPDQHQLKAFGQPDWLVEFSGADAAGQPLRKIRLNIIAIHRRRWTCRWPIPAIVCRRGSSKFAAPVRATGVQRRCRAKYRLAVCPLFFPTVFTYRMNISCFVCRAGEGFTRNPRISGIMYATFAAEREHLGAINPGRRDSSALKSADPGRTETHYRRSRRD